MKRIAKNILRPLVPALVTILVILLCAAAPQMQEVPELLAMPETASPDLPDSAPAEQPDEEPAAEEPKPEKQESAVLLEAAGNYPDGVYIGTGTGYGGPITVEVTVENGQIVSIEILSADGEDPAFLRRADSVIDRILSAQSWDVDAVSGATYSSEGIKAAVCNALTGGEREDEADEDAEDASAVISISSDSGSALVYVAYTAPADGYADGSYTGSAQGFGGLITVQVTISGGRITSIAVLSAPGETSAYLTQAEQVIPSILSAQSPNVDTVSGATYSSSGIINAVKAALQKAAVSDTGAGQQEQTEQSEQSGGETAPAEIPNYGYPDGIYTGTGEGYLWGEICVQVTVSGGQITDIAVLSAQDQDESYFSRALQVLDRVLAAQTWEVDAISGATYSSEGILEAVADALFGEEERTETGEPSSESESSDAAEPEASPAPSEEPEPSEKPELSPEEPDSPSESLEVTVTTETSSQRLRGTATVHDRDGDFTDYDITVRVTVTETVVTENDGVTVTVTTTRAITDITVSSVEDSFNQAYLNRALSGMKQRILSAGSTDVDSVSSATCSSEAIKSAVDAALADVELGTTQIQFPAE